MESGVAAFEINYPFVYPSMKSNNPALFKNFRWAVYPRVDADRPSRPTIGGIDLAVSAYSRHPDLAFDAALCLRDRENQLNAALKGGLPPTLRAIYDEPDFMKEYPFSKEVLASLESASVRPLTPPTRTCRSPSRTPCPRPPTSSRRATSTPSGNRSTRPCDPRV
ncbi:hypothetical protein ACFQV4_22200 [Streptomyces thermocarboxydus]